MTVKCGEKYTQGPLLQIVGERTNITNGSCFILFMGSSAWYFRLSIINDRKFVSLKSAEPITRRQMVRVRTNLSRQILQDKIAAVFWKFEVSSQLRRRKLVLILFCKKMYMFSLLMRSASKHSCDYSKSVVIFISLYSGRYQISLSTFS